MATNIDIVDLTTDSSTVYFSDNEDKEVFGLDKSLLKLFKYKICKLKHNDPNVAILNLRGDIPLEVCERIGIYLWSSKYIKNLQLGSCSLTSSKVSTQLNYFTLLIYNIISLILDPPIPLF